MSARSEEIIGANALEIESCASEWIERRLFGVWGVREETELNAWRAQSLAHEIAFLRLEAGWGRTERLAALRSQKTGNPVSHGGQSGQLLPIRAAVTAAALAIFGVAGSIYLSGPAGRTYSTSTGGHKTIAFSDGSKIELNTDTLIRTSDGSAGREVDLIRGEAYFQVKHDSAKPFVVLAAGHRLTDLGTKFLIRNDSDRLKISLLEGRVELQSNGAGVAPHSAVLVAGDVAVANANSLSVM